MNKIKLISNYIAEYAIKGLKLIVIVCIFMILADMWGKTFRLKYQSPVLIERRIEKQEFISPIVEEEQSYTPETIWAGVASWYGAKPEWCVGCNPDFIMANGNKLDDTKKTLAFNDLPLGDWVVITNVANGKSEEVEITDTGGFKSLDRIADMSLALKNALDCSDLCDVTIETY